MPTRPEAPQADEAAPLDTPAPTDHVTHVVVSYSRGFAWVQAVDAGGFMPEPGRR